MGVGSVYVTRSWYWWSHESWVDPLAVSLQEVLHQRMLIWSQAWEGHPSPWSQEDGWFEQYGRGAVRFNIPTFYWQDFVTITSVKVHIYGVGTSICITQQTLPENPAAGDMGSVGMGASLGGFAVDPGWVEFAVSLPHNATTLDIGFRADPDVGTGQERSEEAPTTGGNPDIRSGYDGWGNPIYGMHLEISYTTPLEDNAIITDPATNITQTSATLNGRNEGPVTASCYFEWEAYDEEWNVIGNGTTTPQNINGAFSASLSIPSGWYQVDFRAAGEYEGDTAYGGWEYFIVGSNFAITTLPTTEVWATGAKIHGMIENTGLSAGYAYAGFQWGPNSDVSAEVIHWSYSGSYGHGKVPIQATISGLLPDRTYYYRACLHEGTPPMDEGNIFGSTLSFGGPVSIFGHGWEYVTAKKAEDDVSKLAAGRYYMDKSGNFVYESAQHRKA